MSKEDLGNSKTLKTMQEFVTEVSKYPPAHIPPPSKPKKEMAIMRSADQVYDAHTNFNQAMNDFSSSLLLVCNDMAVPYMAQEVGRFCAGLDYFYNKIKQTNNVQELQQYYKQFTLKSKAVVDSFMNEVGDYIERYAPELDKKQVIQMLNESKEKQMIVLIGINKCTCGKDLTKDDLLIDSLYPVNREKTKWNFSCTSHNGGCGRVVYANSELKVVERWNSGVTDETI